MCNDLLAQLALVHDQFRVNRRTPLEHDPHSQGQISGGRFQQQLHRLAHHADGASQVCCSADVNVQRVPPEHIHLQPLKLGDLAILGSDQQRTTRTQFADVAALQVARVGNRDIATLHPVFMYMAERPVLVALGLQFGH